LESLAAMVMALELPATPAEQPINPNAIRPFIIKAATANSI